MNNTSDEPEEKISVSSEVFLFGVQKNHAIALIELDPMGISFEPIAMLFIKSFALMGEPYTLKKGKIKMKDESRFFNQIFVLGAGNNQGYKASKWLRFHLFDDKP